MKIIILEKNMIMEEENSFNFKKSIFNKVKVLGLKSRRFSYQVIGSKANKEVDRAKSKHRTDIDLKDWKKLRYYEDNWCENMIKNPPKGVLQISYDKYENLSIEEFREKYEYANKPVIITGVTNNWPASNKWSFDVNIKYIYNI